MLANSQLESTISSNRASSPEYKFQQCGLLQFKWYIVTIRDERSPDSRHKNTKIDFIAQICILKQISRVFVCRKVLEQLANGMCPSSTSCVTSWHCVHSNVANVSTILHVEQVTQVPELRRNLRTKRKFPRLENTSATWTNGCTP